MSKYVGYYEVGKIWLGTLFQRVFCEYHIFQMYKSNQHQMNRHADGFKQ